MTAPLWRMHGHISICTLPLTLLEYYLLQRSNCLPCSFPSLGCGIERLVEVPSDRVESLQTAPERLGRSELAERCAGEGGEFAVRPWPESLPPRAVSPEAGRSWRGWVVGVGRNCEQSPPPCPGRLSPRGASLSRLGQVWTRCARPRQGWEFADRPCRGPLAAALRLPRLLPRPQARSSPGSRAAGSGYRDPEPRRAVGPAETATSARAGRCCCPARR